MKNERNGYYTEFSKATNKIIREQDQSASAAGIVREIESHRSGLEEKEERAMTVDSIGDMVHNALTEAYEGVPIAELEEMDAEAAARIGDVLADKMLASREEDYPESKELTPGEISKIVNSALRDLPEALREEHESEISDMCFDVAYAVMHKFSDD